MASGHLPVVISVSIGGTHPSIGSEYTKRPKVNFSNFDKKTFILLISSCMSDF